VRCSFQANWIESPKGLVCRYRYTLGYEKINIRQVITWPNFAGYYYLCDAGYPNAEGFLAPYRGQRYHLTEWRGGNPPTSPMELFNMRHSSARNVIERAFGMLKGRWAILRGKSYYPVDVQCKTIHACCLLHNLIIREMGPNSLLDEGEGSQGGPIPTDNENIEFVETSDAFTAWRDNIANQMWAEWNAN